MNFQAFTGAVEAFVGVNFFTMIAAWCNLLILFLILKKLLFKPLKNMIDSRQKEIDDMYADAESSKKSAENMRTEYEEFAIPQPDLSIFLDVPFAFTERKLQQEVRTGEDRDYLNGQKDIHEASLDLQRRVREVYLEAAACSDDIKVVDCSTAEGTMASPEAIYERIMQHITPLIAK